jgi:hypothetical protein
MKRVPWIAISCCCATVILLLVWQGRRRSHSNAGPSAPAQGGALRSSPITLRTNSVPRIDAASVQSSTNALRPVLAAAIGQAQERDFRTRLKAIGQLGSSLPLGEREVLYQHVRDHSEDKWLRPGQGFALKNEILNLLCEQEETPPELADFLFSLWRDTSQPIAMRDYALQHLAPLFSETFQAQQVQIIKELQAAASEIGESYAGTALLALNRIQQENPSAETPPLAPEVRRIVDDPAANLLTRISAVQLSGELNLQEMANAVSQIALDETQAKTLRLAAIGALGRVAGEGETTVLQRIKNQADERLRIAAASALKRLGHSH